MNDETRKFFEKLAGTSNDEGEFEPQLIKASKVDIEINKNKVTENEEVDEPITNNQQPITEKMEEDFDEGDGSLAIDVYQTENDIVVMAPIAGVAVDDLDIDITPESVTIKGKREKKEKIEKKDFLYMECYWGRFSRSIILPQEINPDHATAAFKNGVLKIVLPKLNKSKAKKMKIKFE
jgi:HSP20 family protein